MMKAGRLIAATLLLGAAAGVVGGCKDDAPVPPPASRSRPAAKAAWTAKRIAVIEDLDVPECVAVDPASGAAYISNVQAAEGQFWGDDGKGFITRLRPGGELEKLRWKTAAGTTALNAPKGMCLFGGALYVADNTRVVKLALDPAASDGVVKGLTGKRLNDMATYARAVYVSDTADGKIYRIDEARATELKAPKGVNGITFFKDKMFAVSWASHDVYELDPAGEKDPKPFGLADHFTALDGIEVLDDGTFIVSDFEGNKVCTISPDRKSVRALCRLKTPADIGLDRRSDLMYVPQFHHKRVVIYRLEKGE